jgi:hypothetical protein
MVTSSSMIGATRVSAVGGGGDFSGLSPGVLSSDGAIRESIAMGDDARLSYTGAQGDKLGYGLVSQAPAGSAERRNQFDTLMLAVVRLDNVPASDRRRVVDQLCEQNPTLAAARTRFLRAEPGVTVPAQVPPWPVLA